MRDDGESSSVRLVCFDLGGVLIRICRTWAEACERAGVDLRETPLNGEAIHDREQLVIEYQTGRMTHHAFTEGMSSLLNGIYSPHEVAMVHRAWTMDEYDGVSDVIDAIHDRGLRTACLSNTNAVHIELCEPLPALQKLQHRLYSHELGLHKPDPAIFRAAERILDVDGQSLVYFDDLEMNVDAARACGWDAVLVDYAGPVAQQLRAALRGRGIAV